MFLIRILNYQIVILTISAGVVIVISMILGYIDIWRYRDKRAETDEGDTEWLSMRESIAWFVVFTNLIIIGIGILYTIYRIINPPNW